jgi:hypothetical protein
MPSLTLDSTVGTNERVVAEMSQNLREKKKDEMRKDTKENTYHSPLVECA